HRPAPWNGPIGARMLYAATPSPRAISRIGTPPTNFNRRTSRTWRMIVLSAGIRSLLWNSQRRGPESASRGHLPSRARSSRNGGRHHLGTVGGIISEWVGGIIPESWAACSGIRTLTLLWQIFAGAGFPNQIGRA